MLSFIKSKLSVLLKNPYLNRMRGVPFPNVMGNEAQVEIARLLNLETPQLIARVGETEARAAAFFLTQRSTLSLNRDSYPKELKSRLKLLAGYFPTTDEGIDCLAKIYLNAIEAIDLHAVWTPHDAILKSAHARTIRLVDLDPFFFEKKWTLALEGKRICVVSPFASSMQRQYGLRDKLFPTPTIPEFDLCFAAAPMTHCESDVSGQSWVDNKNRLVEAVLRSSPEIAIIGAGAYGLPVAYALKKEGITSIVMGGSTQLLFGLRGKRWENDKQYRRLMNEHWIRPDEDERPPGFQNFEISGGAYW